MVQRECLKGEGGLKIQLYVGLTKWDKGASGEGLERRLNGA